MIDFGFSKGLEGTVSDVRRLLRMPVAISSGFERLTSVVLIRGVVVISELFESAVSADG